MTVQVKFLWGDNLTQIPRHNRVNSPKCRPCFGLLFFFFCHPELVSGSNEKVYNWFWNEFRMTIKKAAPRWSRGGSCVNGRGCDRLLLAWHPAVPECRLLGLVILVRWREDLHRRLQQEAVHQDGSHQHQHQLDEFFHGFLQSKTRCSWIKYSKLSIAYFMKKVNDFTKI